MKFVTTLLGLALAAFVVPSGHANHLRADSFDEYMTDEYVTTGYLAALAGTLKIGWSADVATDEFVGPATTDTVQQSKLFAGTAIGAFVSDGRNPFIPATEDEVFTSVGLARPLFLNLTRHVHVDLLVKPSKGDSVGLFGTSPFPNLRVELRILGPEPRRIAGSTHWTVDNWGSGAPGVPPGHGLLSYWMHPEVDVIPAGSIIELRIVHIDESSTFQIRLKGEYRSVIRFASYPPEELPFRLPPSAFAAASPGGSGSATALVPLTALALPRRRACLLLLAVAASGCAQVPGASPSSGSPDASTYVIHDRNNSTGLTDNATGVLAASVTDESGSPLPGVRVSIVDETTLIGVQTETDGWGRFTSSRLVPSLYRVTLDKEGYERWQESVRIQRSAITVLNATLHPLFEGNDDQSRHRHDDWGAATEKILVDAKDVDFRKPPEEGGACCISLPLGAKVLPGTREVQVRVHWDPATGVTKLGMGVGTNAFSISLAARGPDDTFRIPVSWEHNDNGHQNFSTWGFYLWEPPPPEQGGLNAAVAALQHPAILMDVQIRIIKGLVPLENPHPNRWGGEVAKYILKDQATARIPDFFAPATYHAGVLAGHPEGFGAERPYRYFWDEAEVVPVGTAWMEGLIHVTSTSGGGPPPNTDWLLAYKAGDTPRQDCDLFRYGNAARIVKVASHAQDTAQHLYHFRFPLGPNEPDSIYATRSSWCFAAIPTDELALTMAYYPQRSVPILSLTIVAHRDPMPA